MHVAVLGAGYAGLVTARRLERSLPESVRLTVVNDRDHHLVQHEIHRAIRRPSIASDLRMPLDEVFDRAEVRVSTVESVDVDAGAARLANGRLEYDYGAVCLGARTDFHDLPGVAEHGLPLKRLRHAERIRSRFRESAGGRAVVGGAGLSGVQVAGELAAMADEEGYDADVVLLERLDDVAPSFPENFREAVRDELLAHRVRVRTGAAVASADESAVETASGERFPYDLFVWTGGVRGSDAMRGDRPTTRADLRASNGTFVVGDAARVVDADGERVPPSAQSAVEEARVAASNIATLVEHERSGGGEFPPRLERFRHDPTGWVVSVGHGAVAQVGPTVLRGRAARAAKATVGAKYLGGDLGSVRTAVGYVRNELGRPASRKRGER